MLAEELLEVHRDHDGRVDAGGLWGGVFGVALDVLHERLAHPAVQRLPAAVLVAELVVGVPGWVREGLEVALEHRAGVGGDGEPAVAAAVAVVGEGELDAGVGACLLGREGRGFLGFAELGCDDVEDPPAEAA